LPNPSILRAELRRLFRWLKKKGMTAIITGERGDNALTRHGRDRTAGGLRAAIDSEANTWVCEYRFLRADGTWADIYDRAYIARDISGKAWRVVGAMQDLTKRKRAEEALNAARADAAVSHEPGILPYRCSGNRVLDGLLPFPPALV
jgi:PAS domain-containing protein